jgi:hypothetical protein
MPIKNMLDPFQKKHLLTASKIMDRKEVAVR